MAQSCTYTFNGPDGKEVTIRGMAAMKAYLVDGGMEFFQTKGVRFEGLEKVEAKPVVIDKPASGEAPSVLRATDADPSNQRITRAQADGFLSSFLAKYANAPQITLVNTFDQLPATVQQEARNQGGNAGDTKGVFHRGQVYLVAGNHSTVADFEATVFHEVIGHAGVRALFGDDFVKTANRLFMQLGGQAGLVKIMQKRGMGQQASDYIKGIAQAQRKELDQIRADMAAGKPGAQRRWNDAIARFVLTEEVFAHIAEQVKDRPSMMDKIKELIGKVRQWLRDKGFAELADMGETDILFMLSKARESLRTPAGKNGGGGITRNGVTVSGSDLMTNDGRRLDQNDPDYGSAMRLADLLGLRQEPGVTTFRNDQSTIDVDGVQRSRLNSDGKPIHPTEEGIRNFWRFFKDSKAVDGNGRPLVVYHGTSEDFEVFDNSKDRSKKDHGFLGRGFYFSTSEETAGSYANMKGGASAPNIMPAYASLQNPLLLSATSKKTKIGVIRNELGLPYNLSYEKVTPESAQEITNQAQSMGYDGVIFSYDIYQKRGVAVEREIVAFRPEQIKSATGNNGAFDPNEAPITLRRAPSATPQQGQSARERIGGMARDIAGRMTGKPVLDPADPFAAENARLREQDASLWKKAKTLLRRQLSPGGLLPGEVFAEKIKRDSEFQAVEFDVRHMVGGLERAVQQDFGVPFDKLTDEQMKPINDALAGKVPDSLPEATKTAVTAMRQYIDGLSGEYLTIIQGKIDALMQQAQDAQPGQAQTSAATQAINEIELYEKIRGNIGAYVHRSYQAFDDPKWFEKVPSATLNAAREYLKQGYIEKGDTEAEAQRQAEVALYEILKNGTAYDSMEAFIGESKLGAKDLSVLMRRKEVPPQIRALLGEYTDPRLNFAKSTTKMGRLIWNQRFLDRVREIGMGTFLFEGTDRPPQATKQIAAAGSEVYAPMNGLWTFPEIDQAFRDALGKEQMSDLYRFIVRANGLVKYGKAQPLDAEIKTPTGPIVMGDVEVGTVVCGIDGPTTVTGVFPQGDMDVYRLTFCDGSSTEASDEHLWNVTIDGKERTLTTADLLSLPSYRIAKRQVSVPLGRAHFDTKDVPLDPYLMGVLLGDGSFRGRVLRLSTPEKDIVDRVRALLPEGYAMNSPASWSDIDYAITAPNKSEGRRHKIRVALEEMGLWGHLSLDKFIPVQYMRNSHEIRMEVARGLLDTDGWVDRLGQPHFTTSSRRLAEDFQELAESLGASVIWGEKESASGNIAYDLGVRVEDAREWFWLPRKAEKATPRKKPAKRTIATIEYVGMKQCQCIMVDDPRHLYLTDRFIVTHNTVLSPTTAMRNWQSAMFFSLANGHFDMTQMKKSIAAFREQVSQRATGDDLQYLRHLKRLGVVYDTPYAGEMMRLLSDARMDEILSTEKGSALRWFRKANQLAQGFYSFGDDFWKIIGFENEKAGLMKAGLSMEAAEQEAARRIRDTYPTYSMVGRGINWLSRFPLAGTFVSFPAEIIRTTANMFKTVNADLKSDNPELRKLGMRRAVGMAMVSAAFFALSALSRGMAGVDDDEEEALRDLAPDWQKNSTFLFLGRDEKGQLRYFDLSFLDPYGYFKRPLTAMMRNQPWEDGLASGLRDLLTPFLGADITAQAIMEAVSNKKGSGGRVYKENDGPLDQSVDIADHLRKALQPGVIGNVERIVKAAQGVKREGSGQPFSVEDELVALVGWRASTMDPKTALYYRAFEFNDAITEARQELTKTLRSVNDVSPDEILDARQRATEKQREAFTEMGRLVQAARNAGMTNAQVMQVLKLSNVSTANVGALIRGNVPQQLQIGPQTIRNAVNQARTMQGDEFAREVSDRYRTAMTQ